MIQDPGRPKRFLQSEQGLPCISAEQFPTCCSVSRGNSSTYVLGSSWLLDEFSTPNRIQSSNKRFLVVETSITVLVCWKSVERWVVSFSLSLSNKPMSCFRETCGNAIAPPSVFLSDLELEISKCPGWERGWFDLVLFIFFFSERLRV